MINNMDNNILRKIMLASVAGERLIQFATENLVTEVLIHPQVKKYLVSHK